MKNIAFIIAVFVALTLLPGLAFAEIDPEYKTGLKYYNSGQYAEAVKVFKDYVKKKPVASAYYRIGYSLYKLDRHDEAIEYFKEAYLVDPDFSPVLVKKK